MKGAQSLQRILNLMKKFQEFSSLTINVEKCEAAGLVEPKIELQSQSSVSGALLQKAVSKF